MTGKCNVAVVGATGAVGNEMLAILEERDFPLDQLRLLASERSVGESIKFRDNEFSIELLASDSFKGIDLALFSAGGARSREYASCAVEAGAVVVDNTSTFRMDPDVPLVVPEVNSEALEFHKGIIANPNCSTIQMVVGLKPIHDAVGIKRVVVSTYQSVSGTGKKAIAELERQVRDLLNFQETTAEVYPHQIAFNCLPHIADFQENGYSDEEIKMIDETRKILGIPDLLITATTVLRCFIVIQNRSMLKPWNPYRQTRHELYCPKLLVSLFMILLIETYILRGGMLQGKMMSILAVYEKI